LMGLSYRSYLAPEIAEKLFQAFSEVCRTGGSEGRIEYPIVGKDGTRIFVETSISPIRDAAGQATGFRGILRDVSKRKRIEQALQESEKRFRELYDEA